MIKIYIKYRILNKMQTLYSVAKTIFWQYNEMKVHTTLKLKYVITKCHL